MVHAHFIFYSEGSYMLLESGYFTPSQKYGLANNLSIFSSGWLLVLSRNKTTSTTPQNVIIAYITITSGTPRASTIDRNVNINTMLVSQLISDAKDTA